MTPEQRQDIEQYKLLMDKVYELTDLNFESEKLLADSKFYLELIEEINKNELISGKGKLFQDPKHSKKLEELVSEIKDINKDRFYPKLVMAALGVVAAGTTAGLAFSIKGFQESTDDENQYFNMSTVILDAVAGIASAIALGGYVIDHKTEQSKSKHLNDNKKVTATIKAKESAREFIRDLHKNELDRLNNNRPHAKIENESRIEYWEELCGKAFGGVGKISDVLEDRDEKINLIYARIAIASYYSVHPHKNRTKVEEISRENLDLMHSLANIHPDLSVSSSELVSTLCNIDSRLPTLYAKASYRLGRVATIKWQEDGRDQYLPTSERKKLKVHLESACEIRKEIDTETRRSVESGEAAIYDDYFNRYPSDSLLFHRSGALEYQLGDMHREINSLDMHSASDKELIAKDLKSLLLNYEKSREISGNFLHQATCEEKMMDVISLLVGVVDNSKDRESYADKAKTILFFTNDPTPDNLSKMIIASHSNPHQDTKTILRSAVKYSSILRNTGEKGQAKEIEKWIKSNEEVRGGKHPEVNTAIPISAASSLMASATPSNTPSNAQGKAAHKPAITIQVKGK